jgi:segregation and condensation protein B
VESSHTHRSVKDLVENLLFMAQEPLSLSRMADALPHSKEEIAAALDALQVEYLDRGLKLRFVSGGWELTTDPSLSNEVREFFDLQKRKRLSRQALETLTVIAYNQPITRSAIEAVRGVQTSGTLGTLLESGLIRIVGQKDTVGNPYIYGTTDEFLRHFGLGDVSELPPLEFEREGLKPPFDKDTEEEKKSVAGNGEVKPVDFVPEPEPESTESNVQQKGA